MKYKNQAVDLTDLAMGIVILGIVVSIGANVLVNLQSNRLTDLSTYSTANESITATDAGTTLSNGWFESITSVTNTTGGETVLATGNYSTSVDGFGVGTITFDGSSPYNGTDVNVTYSSYNTNSRADYTVAGDAATGLAEYGNWFDIIVIVGVAALILALIFMAFGGVSRNGASGGVAF